MERFGRDGTVKLAHVIALEDQRACFNHALGPVDQGFTSGEACRVPLPGMRPTNTGRTARTGRG